MFKNIETSADEVLPISFKSASNWFKTFRKLKKINVDMIIELHQTGRSGTFFRWFCDYYDINYFYHNHHDKNGEFVLDQGLLKPNIQRDLDGVFSIFQMKNKSLKVPDYKNFSPCIKNTKEKNKNEIVLGVSAGRDEKIWNIKKFASLIKLYPEKKFLIPLSKNKTDQNIKNKLSEFDLKNVEVLIRPLSEVPSLISSSSYYLGNDTGLKHICAALGLKTLTIFCGENPYEWHPYDLKKHRYLEVGEDKEIKTMNDLDLETVNNNFQELINGD